MTAEELLRYGTQAGFLSLFAVVLVRTVRQRTRTNLNALLFFGAAALLIVVGWSYEARGQDPPAAVSDLTTSLILAFPYLLLRLANDFLDVRPRVLQAAALAFAASVTLVFITVEPIPGGVLLFVISYFLVVQFYASQRFIAASQRTRGLTQHRLRAVAAGTGFLLLVVALAIPAGLFPASAEVWQALSSVAGLASGLAFLAGFAPPALLKAAWQLPEVRRLMSLATASGWLAAEGLPALVLRIEEDIARAIGARAVLLRLWDDEAGTLVAPSWLAEALAEVDDSPAREVYRSQRSAMLPLEGEHLPPGLDGLARSSMHLAAPVSSQDRRFGVLSAYGTSAAAFAGDDLVLLELLADQVAVILQQRELVAELTAARGREEANRLKEDFLSSAAHDLQTPLTSMLGEAQLMERLASRPGGAPLDVDRMRRIIAEALRMRALIRALLDASRAEHASLVGSIALLDLSQLVDEAAARAASRDQVLDQVEASTPVPVLGDATRLSQVIDNLIDNAFKYSPTGKAVRVALRVEAGRATLEVSDHGIGIAPDELPYIFDRFWRSPTLDHRRFVGMGLGLYITRRIVEDHGGTIRAESVPGAGTTFRVSLPLHAGEVPHSTPNARR